MKPIDMPSFGSVSVKLQRFCMQVRDALQHLGSTVPQLDGRYVELPALAAAGIVLVKHGLGRVPRGYQIDRMRRAAGTTTTISVYSRIGDQWDADGLELYSTGAYETLRVWVY